MIESSSFEDAQRRIDKIAEELARGTPTSMGQSIIELRKLCGKHRTVPASYELEGVKKEGDRAQRVSKATEIWTGRYDDKMVAVKVLRVSQEDPSIQRAKSRFCKEVVLMKQLKHDNIVPFLGVSTTVSDFCLVFPWYGKGNIMDYLKNNSDTNQFDLLSDAASGLRFLHKNRLVHGSLRPSHILVDDNGTARLATGGRSTIVAEPGTSIANHMQSGIDEALAEFRYCPCETQWHRGKDDTSKNDKILVTKESDVYGIGMVVYGVLTGNAPYSEYNDIEALEKIEDGELPQKPSGINETVWEFLQKCWSGDPEKRPSAAQVCVAFSQFSLLPKFTPAPTEGQRATGLPGKLKVQVKSIKFFLDRSKQQQFSVKFKYGNKDYTTPPTKCVDGSNEYTWNNLESWPFDTNKRDHGQPVFLELILRAGVFKKDKVCATGKFSLSDNVNKETNVKLEALDSAGSVVLKILLMEAR